jgi:endonuclease/exonuclease/phosphatase (EEP) superfamily protein YafD
MPRLKKRTLLVAETMSEKQTIAETIAQIISRTILLLIVLTTSIAIICSVFGWSYWPERFSHFQIQYWLVVICLFLLLLPFRDRTSILIGLFCAAILSANMVTWYLPAGAPHRSLVKILFSNVWETNRNHQPILDLVRSEAPDIAVFVEVNARWRKQLDSLQDIFPYSRDNKKGEVIYSKIDLKGTEIVEPDPSFIRTLILRNLQLQGKPFTLVVTHPSSPANLTEFAKRNKHLDDLGLYLEKSPDNLIVVGDFNATPWSPYYRKFVDRSRLVNTREGLGLHPTWTTLGVRKFPLWSQPLLSVPIDHIFTRAPNIHASSFHTGIDIGSDHLPIVAEINKW